jgi:hypothetical protein
MFNSVQRLKLPTISLVLNAHYTVR